MNQFFAALATALCFGALTPSPSISMLKDSTAPAVSVYQDVAPYDGEHALSNRQVIAYYLGEYEKSDKQIRCALDIAYDESRYNTDSVNKETGAHGVFQLVQSVQYTKLQTHVRKATEYMEHRYGTWCEAKQFHDNRGWW